MSLITLDFETYYSKEYSLSKMTTEAYIRDPRFQVIGFSYRINDGDTIWFTGTDDELKAKLHSLNLDQHYFLAQNTAFDAAILAWIYGIYPKFLLDTMSMAKPITGLTVGVSLAALAKHFCLGEKGTEVINALGKRREDFSPDEMAKYGEYCDNDVVLTYNLFHVLRQWITDEELYIIDMMLRMFTDPVIELDRGKLEEHLSQVKLRKEQLMEKIDASIGREQLMSNPKFAEVLEQLGVDPPKKISPTTGKEAFAFSKTDAGFKALLEHEDERVQAVVSARLGIKTTLEETRTEAFIGISNRGALPILLHYYGAHTGRASGGDKINLQNLPRGGKLRQALKVPKKHKVIAGDSAQIEARIVAWLAGETALVEAFANKEDIYSLFASDVYGRPIDRKRVERDAEGREFNPDKLEGHVGKTCILGLGFGMGKDKFKFSLKSGNPSVDMDLDECDRIVRLYRQKYPMIPKLWKAGGEALKAMVRGQEFYLGVGIQLKCDGEGIHLPNGMMLRYPNLRWNTEWDSYVYDTKKGPKKIYGAKVIENVVQALARIVVFRQMCKIDQNIKKYDNRAAGRRFKTALTVHDEVVTVVPEQVADQVKALMQRVMSKPPNWAADLPISCEVALGHTYGDCK